MASLQHATAGLAQRGFAASAVVLALAAPARAETSDVPNRTAAEALFSEGRRLMREGKPLEACPKFAESQKLDAGVGTLLNLARCYVALGRTASAWAVYSEAASLARANGQLEREKFARAKVTELTDEIPKLRVNVTDSAGGTLELTIDDAPWSHGLWNVGAPIDPGQHRLVARAPGFVTWSQPFEAKPSAETAITVPVLRPDPADVGTPLRQPAEHGDQGWSKQKTAAMVGAGISLVAIAIGTVFAIDANNTYDRSDGLCTADQRCQPAGLDLRESAFDKARMSTIAFGFAGTALAGSAILWFTAPVSAEKKAMTVGIKGQW